MLRILQAVILAIILAAPAAAAEGEIAAPQALDSAQAGELIIVDIRTPEEWRQTGVVPGAKLVNLYAGSAAAFLSGMLAAMDGNKDVPVALICRTGNRSSRAAVFLRSQGFSNVMDISEGMAGSGTGPGWLRRGLPVEKCNC